MPDALSLDWARHRVNRVEHALKARLGAALSHDSRLNQAMAYVVFNGGKRLRPQLVYASGQLLGLDETLLDAPACAVELIHCYSLVHDDLPAMDDDDLRRGRPTAHLAFDEATAILAGDALQALAFEIFASDAVSRERPAAAIAMLSELTGACGAEGMAGGQAQDLEMEGARPDQASLETMYAMKTGALIRAAVMMPCALVPNLDPSLTHALRRFSECIGLAFQIKDDLLDVEGETAVIGKTAGADQAHQKATWPLLFGIEQAHQRIQVLRDEATACLESLPGDQSALSALADQLLHRDF